MTPRGLSPQSKALKVRLRLLGHVPYKPTKWSAWYCKKCLGWWTLRMPPGTQMCSEEIGRPQ